MDGFRHSVYSDMLFDWPRGAPESRELRYEDKIDLGASGENRGYTVAQIATAFIDFNAVAFYVLKAKKLFVYHGSGFGPIVACSVREMIEPNDLSRTLTDVLGFDLKWLATVTSSEHSSETTTERRSGPEADISSAVDVSNWGVGFSIFVHANTFEKGQVHWKFERVPCSPG
jgi:hypothetical protein